MQSPWRNTEARRARRGVVLRVLALVALAGCSSGDRWMRAPDIPEDVAWVALLAERADNSRVASTPILAHTPGAPIRFEVGSDVEGSAMVHLVGWRAGALPPFVEGSPIRRAEPEEAVLPAPGFAASGPLDGALTIQPSTIEITGDWLPPCPVLLDPAGATPDVSCAARHCDVRGFQLGCRVSVDLGLCAVGVVASDVDGRGRMRFGGGSLPCTKQEPRNGADLSIDCEVALAEGCEIDLHPPLTPAPFDVRAAKLVEQPGTNAFTPEYAFPPFGYLQGLAVLSDRIVVIRSGASITGRPCRAPVRSPSQILFLDPETLETTGTATAPPCLDRIWAEESGLAFLGTSGGTVAPALHRFDASGRVVTSAPLVHARTAGMYARALAAVGAPIDRAGVLMSTVPTPEAPLPEGHVVTLDLASLSDLAVTQGPPLSEPVSIAPIGSGAGALFGATDDDNDLALGFDPESAERVSTLAILRAAWVRTGDMLLHQGRFLIASGGKDQSLYVVAPPSADPSRRRVFFGVDSEPYAIAPWPRDPSLVAVGLTGKLDDRPAILALFSPAEGRFRPRFARIGSGAVGQLAPDRSGRMWALLPWTGEVVRVSVREE